MCSCVTLEIQIIKWLYKSIIEVQKSIHNSFSSLIPSKIINKYLSYKNKYEFLYLNGLYDEARIILNKIDHEISYSYWAMSNYIRMERMQKGVNAAIKVHNEYWHANDNLIIKKFCNAAFYTSALDYSSDIKKKLYYKPENEYAKKLNNLVSTRYLIFECINIT